MDLVWLYGPAERQRTGELRYSLRSAASRWHGPVGRAVVAGWAPPWFTGPVIEVPPVEQDNPGRKHWQTTANLLAACEALTEPFVLMNDDFFFMEAVSEIPTLHAGPYLRSRYQVKESVYGEAHRRTADLLRAVGSPDPRDYELHVPLVVSPQVMGPILRKYGHLGPICKRTLYGNLAGIGGRPAKDVKIYSVHSLIPAGPFASTSDAAWCGRSGDWIRRLFPEPSPWER